MYFCVQVNDLLKEESAHVKEAFQKLEEFTSSLEQKSKDTSLLLDQCKPVNQSGSTEEVIIRTGWLAG